METTEEVLSATLPSGAQLFWFRIGEPYAQKQSLQPTSGTNESIRLACAQTVRVNTLFSIVTVLARVKQISNCPAPLTFHAEGHGQEPVTIAHFRWEIVAE
jgi:hypothetical protein